MRFWDSSALVPLFAPENETESCRILLQKDPVVVVWALAFTEVLSSFYRKIRRDEISDAEFWQAQERLSKLSSNWVEIAHLERVRQKANRLLAVHPLRAADALQLAAALVAFEDQPEGEEFVTFDRNLADAARREGFRIVPLPFVNFRD